MRMFDLHNKMFSVYEKAFLFCKSYGILSWQTEILCVILCKVRRTWWNKTEIKHWNCFSLISIFSTRQNCFSVSVLGMCGRPKQESLANAKVSARDRTAVRAWRSLRNSVAIIIRLDVVASKICEIPQNFTKIRTYSNTRSSEVIDVGINRCDFLWWLIVTLAYLLPFRRYSIDV